MKIALMTALTGDNYLWQSKLTNPYKSAYCQKRGYDYIYIEYKNSPLGRHPFWDRIEYLGRHLEHYDYIMWLDADAAPVNHDKQIETIVSDGKDFYISQETTHGTPYFNVGSFIIRKSEWSFGLLKHWKSPEVYSVFGKNGNPEQDALTDLYKKNWNDCRAHIKVLGRNEINSIGVGCAHTWKPGDFVKHLACQKNRQRFEEEWKRNLSPL